MRPARTITTTSPGGDPYGRRSVRGFGGDPYGGAGLRRTGMPQWAYNDAETDARATASASASPVRFSKAHRVVERPVAGKRSVSRSAVVDKRRRCASPGQDVCAADRLHREGYDRSPTPYLLEARDGRPGVLAEARLARLVPEPRRFVRAAAGSARTYLGDTSRRSSASASAHENSRNRRPRSRCKASSSRHHQIARVEDG
jgi:hypothetical protein